MACNEEANIALLLQEILAQEVTHGELIEIIVVSSGCTDRTEQIVFDLMPRDGRIRLLTQRKREGKASAINFFLTEAAGDILILESGDTLPEHGTFDKLIAPFADPLVGMTGGRPVPVNDPSSFMGHVVHMMWRMHHAVALSSPKLGEVIAFRNFVKQIPGDTATDEASIEAIVTRAGFKLVYVPGAIVRNKGPETVSEFILQRRRIAAGHYYLQKNETYSVSTSSPLKILSVFVKELLLNPSRIFWSLGMVVLEVVGRVLGFYDARIRGKNPFIWDIAPSTKRLE
jgi:cellulose synthase/poly-beta-1,6-N-acetylglucosamine synthase-like glycosyltransferase